MPLLTGTQYTVISEDRPNLFINGNFDVWQRGTTFAAASYGPDRFEFIESSAAVITHEASTDVPAKAQVGVNLTNSYYASPSVADTSIAAGDYAGIFYGVEGYDLAPYKNEQLTLSFWVKSSVTGTYCVTLRESTNGAHYVMEYTVDTANTWEKKTLTFTHDDTLGTWDYTNGRGLYISFMLACGTTFHTTKDVWTTGNKLATSSQVNWLSSTSNTIRFAGMRLDPGSEAKPLELKPFPQVLQECKRYYQKTYDYGTTPGTVTNAGMFSIYGAASQTNRPIDTYFFEQEMRATPTQTYYNPATGTTGTWRDISAATNYAVGNYVVSTKANTIYVNTTPGVGNQFSVHIILDADF